MKTRMATLGWMLLLAGCSYPPVTDGFQSDLPKPGTPTIVWGDDLSAVGMATTWLQKRGLSVVERSLLLVDFESETMNLGHMLRDEAAVLQAAKKRGAAHVVFVDRGGDHRAPMITVRGVDVESGRVQWTGSARYAAFETRPPKDTLANLTCEALATAWEFRPPGTKWFMDSYAMCGVAKAK
ncbi:MAG: hypothetical protein ACREIS_08515 [Nitrospiraceae bacterium]